MAKVATTTTATATTTATEKVEKAKEVARPQQATTSSKANMDSKDS